MNSTFDFPIKILSVLQSKTPMETICVKGWVRTRRDSKNFSFIELNDGSCLKNLQVIADESLPNYEDIKKINKLSNIGYFNKKNILGNSLLKNDMNLKNLDFFGR